MIRIVLHTLFLRFFAHSFYGIIAHIPAESNCFNKSIIKNIDGRTVQGTPAVERRGSSILYAHFLPQVSLSRLQKYR